MFISIQQKRRTKNHQKKKINKYHHNINQSNVSSNAAHISNSTNGVSSNDFQAVDNQQE